MTHDDGVQAREMKAQQAAMEALHAKAAAEAQRSAGDTALARLRAQLLDAQKLRQRHKGDWHALSAQLAETTAGKEAAQVSHSSKVKLIGSTGRTCVPARVYLMV